MSIHYTYYVKSPGEPAAGLVAYHDEVTVVVDSGEPGGEPGEFENYMQRCLAEWYGSASVSTTCDEPEDEDCFPMEVPNET